MLLLEFWDGLFDEVEQVVVVVLEQLMELLVLTAYESIDDSLPVSQELAVSLMRVYSLEVNIFFEYRRHYLLLSSAVGSKDV